MPTPTRVRFLVMAFFCAAAALAYVHRNAIAVPAKEIEEELEISHDDMGHALGMFFWGYALMQIPGGWMGGSWGSRRVVPVLLLISSALNGLLALGLGYEFLLLCRFLMGMTQAALFPCAVQSFARWFPPSQRALPNGFLTSFMSVGGVLATGLTGFLLQYLDWQALMILYGAPGVFLAIWFAFWFRDRPEEHRDVNAEELTLIHPVSAASTSEGPSVPKPPWHQVFLSVALALVCVQQFFRAAAYSFYATWWPTFLREARGLDVEYAGYVSTLPLAGVAIGAIVGGHIADWLFRKTGNVGWSRKGLAVVSLFSASLLMVLGYWTSPVWLTVALLTLSSFFAGVCGTASYVITIDLGGKQVATVFSVMNMSGNIGAAILPSLVISVQKENGWDSALLLLAGFYAIAALAWMGVRQKRGEA